MALVETYMRKKLIEIMVHLMFYTSGERLKFLSEIAQDVGMKELIEAIELYWQSEADQLTVEDFLGEQEVSVKAQFGEDHEN